MTDFDRLRGIAEREAARYLRDFSIFDLEVIYRHGLTGNECAEVLRMIRTDARIPAPPRVIRTREELAALDPDTLLEDTDGSTYVAQDAQKNPGDLDLYADDLPAVVIAALHHELADKDVPLESAHLYVTKWMDSIIRWSR